MGLARYMFMMLLANVSCLCFPSLIFQLTLSFILYPCVRAVRCIIIINNNILIICCNSKSSVNSYNISSVMSYSANE